MSKFIFLLCFLTIYIGSCGQISFQPVYYPIANTQVTGAGVGDFNGDGRLDIVTAGVNNEGNGALFLFTQTDSGTLNPVPTTIPFNHGGDFAFINMTTADLDTDQLTDVVLCDGDSLYIYYQSAGHTLEPQPAIYAGQLITGLAVGDIDTDGYNDIVMSFDGESVMRIFYGTPKRDSFAIQEYPFENYQPGINLGIVGHRTSLSIFNIIYDTINETRINSNRTLNSIRKYPIPSNELYGLGGVAGGDRFGDGNNELVASINANSPYSELLYYDNPDSSTESDASLPVPDLPQNLIITDLNCGGKGEIVIGQGGWDEVSVVLPDNSVESFPANIPNNMNSLDMTVADVTGDGKPDIIVVNTYDGITVLENTTPELIDTLPLVTDTILGDSLTVIPYPPVQRQDTVLAQGDTIIIETETLSIIVTEHDSLLYFNNSGYGVGKCYGDTVNITETSTEPITTYYTADTGIIATTFDTMVFTNVQDLSMAFKNIMVYPNPFTDGIMVKGLPGEGNLELYDETGCLLCATKCNYNGFMPRQTLPQGVYILKVTCQNYSTCIKVTAL